MRWRCVSHSDRCPTDVSRRPDYAGLTLLDMVIAMLVAAILAAVAVPKFGAALQSYRLELGMQRLIADLKYAETLARTRSTPLRLIFVTRSTDSSSYYEFDQIPDPDHPDRVYRVVLSDEPYGIRLQQAPAELDFSIEGTPTETASFVLEVANRTRTVVIESSSGQIHES
jgi:Tfp pilus assembly protein FimT